MAIKRYIAEADNTITNAFEANLITRATKANMGAADVLETFVIHGQTSASISAQNAEEARILIQFDLNKISGYRLDRITDAMHKLQRRIEDDGFDRMNMFCKTCCKKAMLLLEDINSDNYIFNTGVFAGNKKSIKRLNFIKRLKRTKKVFDEAVTDNLYPKEINKWWKPNNEVFVSYMVEKFKIPYNNIGLQWNFILDNWNPKPSASGYLLHYIKKEFNLTLG